jgi:hypothetical protein
MAIDEVAREHDWARLAALYELQAWWLDEEGRDAFRVTRFARRAELRALAEQGVATVKVNAGDGETCAACRRVSGRVMTTADAQRLVPIPYASCTYHWCRWPLGTRGRRHAIVVGRLHAGRSSAVV